MLKLDTLDLQQESFLNAGIKIWPIVRNEAHIAHGEYPTLRLEDSLPGLLVKGYHQRRCCNFYRDLVVLEVLIESVRYLGYLVVKLLIFGLCN